MLLLLATLAALTFPSFSNLMKRGKNQEATEVLLAVYIAQKDYQIDNSMFAASLVDLDVEVPTPRHFTPNYTASTASCGGSPVNTLARMAATDGGYTLHLRENGSIVCTPCPGGICQKMGYDPF